VQLYTANFLKNPDYPLKGGYKQSVQTMFCLETQCMPDSINQVNFTNTVLRPNEVLDTTTEYRFSVK
ncbi:MAG: galactose-1-epimerase, partial [Ruminiclostridium sp.]|nr:galactose-1-epimerase [Ruminiclostridium sp.]